MIRVIHLLVVSRVHRKKKCRVVNGWCVQHVGEYWCMTHNYVWRRGQLPCQGRAL